jgi:hypothetical protein
VVQKYNVATKVFPDLFLARLCGFQAKPYFAAKEGAETPPKVQFDFGKPGGK